MKRCRMTLLAPAVLLALVTAVVPAEEGDTLLLTVEGVVDSVETASGGPGEAVTAIRLRADDPQPRPMRILLAPESALRETGFEVEAGDRLRARVFLSGGDTFEAHKVRNLSRGTMVRLRTLRRIPLWDADGRWQGGPGRQHHGAGRPGTRQRGGR